MKICICSPSRNVYSETFIHTHIARLPGATITLYGEWPLCESEGGQVIPSPLRFAMRYGERIHPSVATVTRSLSVAHLAAFLRRRRVDVVLAEYGTTAAWLVEPCLRARVPLVAHFHGVDAYHQEILSTYATDYRRLFTTAAGIVAVSRHMERQLLALGAPKERISYNPYGVDLTQFVPTDASANEPVFIAVGRFVDKKAPHLTLLAFHRVLEACPEARLAYVGDGYLLEACKQLAEALGIADRVAFHGVRSHPEVATLMSKARAFVQSSTTTTYGDSEGTPLAVLEAGAAALPVVSTRHGGIEDVVIPDVTGFLVNEKDVAAMAERMATLALEAKLAGSMGRRAREHVAAHYSVEKSIETLYGILQRARATNLPPAAPSADF